MKRLKLRSLEKHKDWIRDYQKMRADHTRSELDRSNIERPDFNHLGMERDITIQKRKSKLNK